LRPAAHRLRPAPRSPPRPARAAHPAVPHSRHGADRLPRQRPDHQPDEHRGDDRRRARAVAASGAVVLRDDRVGVVNRLVVCCTRPTLPPSPSVTEEFPVKLAFSYIRSPHTKQAEGASVRRQTERVASWCARSGARLDTATTLHDLGKSAFLGEHRKNPDRYALAAFLKMVENGK